MKNMDGLNKTIVSFAITSLRYELIINYEIERIKKTTIPVTLENNEFEVEVRMK